MRKRVNAKRKGLRREREARKIAEKEGYYVCPAKGSLGVFDFVAIQKAAFAGWPRARAVQVSSGKVYGEKRQKIEDFEIAAEKEIWVKMDYKPWLRCRWQQSLRKWELM